MDIKVIPNGVDLDLFPPRMADPGGNGLIFVGAMDASHNIDAVRFFAGEVLPQIQKQYPDTTFTIVGAKPTAAVMELKAKPGVVVTGRVNDVGEYLHQSTVCVVPLRTGFGIKNKTLEAMAAGVPVVGSDRGLEGLSVDGAGVPPRALRANTPESYVQAICQLFEDSELRHNLSINARQMIETEFTWEQAGRLYEQVCLA
jgi:glycosyltransferase involved in cell wall biosynthesis